MPLPMLGKLFRRDPMAAPAVALYARVVEQARLPSFYVSGGVPDTVDGRFELVSIHAFLLFRRLKQDGAAGAALAQAVFDVMFADMDTALRELGAGDLGVAPRVKRMASGFSGRVAAYDAGLAGSDQELADALRRNLYGTLPRDSGRSGDGDAGDRRAGAWAPAMAAYLRAAAADLERQPSADLLAGRLTFSPPAL